MGASVDDFKPGVDLNLFLQVLPGFRVANALEGQDSSNEGVKRPRNIQKASKKC